MLSITLIPTVQSIEVEKEVKNLIQEKQKIFINIQGIINFLKSKFFKTIVFTIWIISFIYSSFMFIGTVLYVHFNVSPYSILDLIIQISGAILISIPLATIVTIYTLLLPFLIVINFIKEIVIKIISIIEQILDFIDSIINPSYQAYIT